MVTFLSLWETMQTQQDQPLQSSGESSPSMLAVRAGLEMRGEGNRTFWDDFLSLCQNGDGVAELLGVRPDEVSAWVNRIRAAVDNVRREDDNADANQKNVLTTGDASFGNGPN